jgi:hypothetical protein
MGLACSWLAAPSWYSSMNRPRGWILTPVIIRGISLSKCVMTVSPSHIFQTRLSGELWHSSMSCDPAAIDDPDVISQPLSLIHVVGSESQLMELCQSSPLSRVWKMCSSLTLVTAQQGGIDMTTLDLPLSLIHVVGSEHDGDTVMTHLLNDIPRMMTGVRTFAHTTYRRLSGGQQQAVNLAAALVGRPKLVFLDLLNDIPRMMTGVRIHPRGRFIEEYQLGAANQGGGTTWRVCTPIPSTRTSSSKR